MCTLHARKVGTPYSQFGFADRHGFLDIAWDNARRSDSTLAWAVRAANEEGSIRTFSAVAPSGSDQVTQESASVNAAFDAGFRKIKDVVVVTDAAYWPSREFVELLSLHAPPEADFLFLAHQSGLIERWLLGQLRSCEQTRAFRTDTPIPPNT